MNATLLVATTESMTVSVCKTAGQEKCRRPGFRERDKAVVIAESGSAIGHHQWYQRGKGTSHTTTEAPRVKSENNLLSGGIWNLA